jgi:hypothetical protein
VGSSQQRGNQGGWMHNPVTWQHTAMQQHHGARDARGRVRAVEGAGAACRSCSSWGKAGQRSLHQQCLPLQSRRSRLCWGLGSGSPGASCCCCCRSCGSRSSGCAAGGRQHQHQQRQQ